MGRSVGDVDRDQGRDLHDRLRHSRRVSPSLTSTRSANQQRRAQLALAELDELLAHIKDLVIRAKEVGDDNHSALTLEIKEEPFPTRIKMPQIPSYEGKTDPRDHLDAFNDQMDLL